MFWATTAIGRRWPRSRAVTYLFAFNARESIWLRFWHVFRPGPPPPLPVVPPQPVWAGPPEDEIGVAVGIRQTVLSGPGIAVALTQCAAYSNGFEFTLIVRTKEEVPAEELGFGHPNARGERPEPHLRLRLTYADGRTGGTGPEPNPRVLEHYRAASEGRPAPPVESVVIQAHGGGGGGHSWRFDYWVWPLPPEGPATITCEWASRGLGQTSSPLDAAAIRRAGLQAVKLWNEA